MSIEFRAKVLKKHGLFVLFDGESPTRVASPAADRETFASWSRRVLKKEPGEVLVFRPSCVDPRVHMATLADEGEALKELVKENQAIVRFDAAEKLAHVEEVLAEEIESIKQRERKLRANQREKAALKIEEANRRLKQAALVPVEELRALLEDVDAEQPLDDATREFIDRTMDEASNDTFPLEVILRKLLQRQRTIGSRGGDEEVR